MRATTAASYVCASSSMRSVRANRRVDTTIRASPLTTRATPPYRPNGPEKRSSCAWRSESSGIASRIVRTKRLNFSITNPRAIMARQCAPTRGRFARLPRDLDNRELSSAYTIVRAPWRGFGAEGEGTKRWMNLEAVSYAIPSSL